MKKEISLKTDFETAKDIAYFQTIFNKFKHINIKYYIVQDHVQRKKLVINKVASSENIANLFTKGLRLNIFGKLLSLCDNETLRQRDNS